MTKYFEKQSCFLKKISWGPRWFNLPSLILMTLAQCNLCNFYTSENKTEKDQFVAFITENLEDRPGPVALEI